VKNPFRKRPNLEEDGYEDHGGYIQLRVPPGRPPVPASLRDRPPVPTDAILTLWLWCAAANCIEHEAMAAVSAWLDVQPEIANIKLDIDGDEVQP